MNDFLSDKLSKRQRECLELVADGYTSKQIARILNLSPSTVDNHINTAVSVTGAQGRADAARKLAQNSIRQNSPSQSKAIATPYNFENLDKPPKWREFFILPTLWGITAELTWKTKLLHILQISIVVSMAIVAITLIMTGFMEILS